MSRRAYTLVRCVHVRTRATIEARVRVADVHVLAVFAIVGGSVARNALTNRRSVFLQLVATSVLWIAVRAHITAMNSTVDTTPVC